MRESKAQNRIGATPGKLALIGVLAIVLIGSIVLQFSGDGSAVEASASPQERRAADRSPRTATLANRAGDAGTVAEEKAWPRFSLDDLLERDPFAVSEAMLGVRDLIANGADGGISAEGRVDLGREAVLAGIREKGVRGVVVDGDRRAAWIGDRYVKIGDVLDGFRVMDIGPGGVVFVDEHSHPAVGN